MVACSFSQEAEAVSAAYTKRKGSQTHAQNPAITADIYRVMPVCPDIMGLPVLAGLSGVEAGLLENPNEDIKGAGYPRGCAMSHLEPHKAL